MCDIISQGLVAKNPWVIKDKRPSPKDEFLFNNKILLSKTQSTPVHNIRPLLPNDELSYGPGFVQKLRDRYVQLFSKVSSNADHSLKSNRNSDLPQEIVRSKNIYNRRTLSCDALSSDDSMRFSSKTDELAQCEEYLSKNDRPKHLCISSEELNHENQSIMKTTPFDVPNPKNRITKKHTLWKTCSADFSTSAKIESIDNYNHNNGVGSDYNPDEVPEFVRVAKKLKHVPIEETYQSTSEQGVTHHVLFSSGDSEKSINQLKSTNTVLLLDDANFSNKKPQPTLRNTLSSKTRKENIKPNSDFYTIASYDDPTVHSPLSLDFVDRAGPDLGEESSFGSSGDEIEEFTGKSGKIIRKSSSKRTNYEFIGSPVILEKSNLSTGAKRKCGLDFDSNYPVVYAYVDEIEAEEWLPGVKLHFVDYKSLCVRLKKERLAILQQKLLPKKDHNVVDDKKSMAHDDKLGHFEPKILKSANMEDLITCGSEYLVRKSIINTVTDPTTGAAKTTKYFSGQSGRGDLLF